jgi:sulfofructosephosphate aldolase
MRLDALSLPNGGLAMVAVDQREALRGMYTARTGNTVDDQTLTKFKVLVAEVLSPSASGLLVDQEFGLRQIVDAQSLTPNCGLIAAADLLLGPAGGAATDTAIDPNVSASEMKNLGAVALKLLILWRSNEDSIIRTEMAKEFIDSCKSNNLISLVEIIVKPPTNGDRFDREVDIVRAATEAATWGCDVYKAEVPFGGKASDEEMLRIYRLMNFAIKGVWVVLSNGVATEDFERAVKLACQSGASGFLAGRAIWADVVGDENERESLERISKPRLESLAYAVSTNILKYESANE